MSRIRALLLLTCTSLTWAALPSAAHAEGQDKGVHADFLWHPWILESKPSFALPAYVGLGARVLDRNGGGGDEDHFRIGARFVGGLLFDFREVPLDVFVEVAGVTDYRTKGSAFGLDINLGAGVRYYF